MNEKTLRSSFLILTSAFLAMGCANFIKDSGVRRQLQVSPTWVKSTPEVRNLTYRKINRMSALLLRGKQSSDLVIQANALDGLTAHRAKNGDIVWRRKIPAGAESNGLEFKGRIYIGGNDGFFYCLNSQDGSVVWTFASHAENISQAFLDETEGVLYFISSANVVYSIDAESGRQNWIYSRQDTSQFSIRGGGQPILKDSILYTGFSDGALVALQSKTGSVVWETQLNRNKKFRDLDASPVLDGDRLYISGYDDKLYCLSTQKGEVLWKVDGGGFAPVTLLGNRIYYSTSQGEVLSLDRDSGQKIWSYKLKEGLATQVQSIKGVLVFGESQGSVMFLDPEKGRPLAHFEPGRGILAAPSVDEKNGRVYFISGEANLYALKVEWISRGLN